MLTHLRTQRRLSAWLDGALQEGEARATAGHVAVCTRCQQQAESLRRLRALVRGAVPAAPPPDWTGFWAGVVRKIEDGRDHQPARRAAAWGRWLRRPLVAFPGALAAAALVWLTVWQTLYWPAAPESTVVVNSAGTGLPGGTVMVYAPPEHDLAVVWVFETE